MLLYLTDAGVRCAEDFGSDTGRYLDKRQQAPSGSGHTLNIGTNSGPFQVAGGRARQLQKVGASADDLQLVIAGIVRALVPGVPDADVEERAALAAVGATAADPSALQRFRDWALSALRAGSTSAAVAAVSSVTTALPIDAGHLATHLG